MTPEARARQQIDAMLARAGWIVQNRDAVNLHAGPGVAVREVPTATGPADYLLFIDARACGVLEAKAEGVTLLGVGPQGADYAAAAPAGFPAWADPLPFLYLSTGAETLFRDAGDPLPRPRRVFAVHRPETLRARLQAAGGPLRARLAALPPLDPVGLRDCQAEAVQGLETALRKGEQRSLVQMATGAGKTYTACALSHRLLTHARLQRVLFLVDRANLGDQTVREFQGYKPPGAAGLLFTEEFTVQHLRGHALNTAASVVVSTIQRLYAALRGEELDEAADERSSFEDAPATERTVSYNPAIPPETFDLVIVDECHRSIYGSWRQVLDYFDAFIIGLTATPGRHTLGYFNQNLVSEYPFERSVADGVNVGFEVFRIRTEVGERGGTVEAGFAVPHRDRSTRRRRLAALDEELTYTAAQLNRTVEAPNQLRTVFTAFRDALPIQLFPGRNETPKTLVFCRDESHAESVTEIAREVLGLDDRGVQKITYRSTGKKGQQLIQEFRTDHLFRVAVTVDMVATGTDIRPLEALLFLRDVRSAQYFEQMKGRGARTIKASELRRATPSAKAKERFVVIDAVGVTETVKAASEPMDVERSEPLKALLERAGFGHTDEDLCSTLAARLARLARRLDGPAQIRLAQVAGSPDPLHELARALVDAADPARIEARTAADGGDEDAAAASLRAEACRPLAANPALRNAILDEATRAEVIVDELTPDRVLSTGFDAREAERVVDTFREFLEKNRDEIAALAVLYGRPYAQRRLTYAMLRDLAEAMARPPWLLGSAQIWQCYRRLHAARVREPSPGGLMTDLLALVRYALGTADVLEPVAGDVERRFNLWLGREKNAGREYGPAQMEWLRLLKEQVAANAEVGTESLREDPQLAARGGVRAARLAFGAERLPELLEELSETLLPGGPRAEAA